MMQIKQLNLKKADQTFSSVWSSLVKNTCYPILYLLYWNNWAILADGCNTLFCIHYSTLVPNLFWNIAFEHEISTLWKVPPVSPQREPSKSFKKSYLIDQKFSKKNLCQ